MKKKTEKKTIEMPAFITKEVMHNAVPACHWCDRLDRSCEAGGVKRQRGIR